MPDWSKLCALGLGIAILLNLGFGAFGCMKRIFGMVLVAIAFIIHWVIARLLKSFYPCLFKFLIHIVSYLKIFIQFYQNLSLHFL